MIIYLNEGEIMKFIKSKDLIVKSNLPATDYVINPYVGCTNNCKYCYAVFMKRFYKIDKEWGKFVFVKESSEKINPTKYKNKRILISSVTDAYQAIERKSFVTRHILEEFIESEAHIEILTKSGLVTRDIDILKKINSTRVGISIGLDTDFGTKLFERNCDSYETRTQALKILREEGIENYVFISPIFPFITNYKKIILDTYKHVDFIYAENLNLRGAYKKNILELVKNNYSYVYDDFSKVYTDTSFNSIYWNQVENDIREFCLELGCLDKLCIFFYHEKIKKN